MENKGKTFDADIARMCGTNAAVVASLLWEMDADPDDAVYMDGYLWIRASYKRITAYLPFLTVHMVRTAVRKLRKEGIIRAGVYNRSSFDHTYSYAFTDYGRDLMI